MIKQKSPRKIFEWIIIYCQNIAGGNISYFSPPGLNHLQNLTSKCALLKGFGLKSQVNGGLSNLIFSIGFQIKNPVFSNCSEV